MANKDYLDKTGLAYFWDKIKAIIPTKVSELVNDSNYISTETDPTVPAWAKAAEKPMYDVDEITNAQPIMHASQYIDLSGMGYDIAVQEDREAAICDALSNYIDLDALNAAGVYAFTIGYGLSNAYYFVMRYYDDNYPDDPYYLVMEYTFGSDDDSRGLRAYSLGYDYSFGSGWGAFQDFEAASKDIVISKLAEKAEKSHTHTKSQITDFPTSMPASDVYSWAKASTKPTYTASEVGATPIIALVGSNKPSYSLNKGFYGGGGTTGYFRISIPNYSSWEMIMLEVNIRNAYTGSENGKLIISALSSSNTTPFTNLQATTIGCNQTLVYGSDRRYFYVKAAAYGTIQVTNMLIGDSAVNVDLSDVTIDHVTSLPSTYQAATMYRVYSSLHKPSPSDIGAAASSHTHTKSQITDFPTSMTPTAHNHAASNIVAGTLAGQVLANATAVASTGTSQVRNIYLGTTDMTAGTSSLATGNIYMVYE